MGPATDKTQECEYDTGERLMKRRASNNPILRRFLHQSALYLNIMPPVNTHQVPSGCAAPVVTTTPHRSHFKHLP